MEIKRAKHNLLRPVRYEGHDYIFHECILWAEQDAAGGKRHRYSAILQDKASKSIMRVPLEEVEEIEHGQV